ncbi:hypothetical protein TNCV_2894211 [Trichonephila clavipes]|nr:hypothetical protein TNCV_2894211 [Trichonephila clavipes]
MTSRSAGRRSGSSSPPDARFLQTFLSLLSIRCSQTVKKYTGGVLALHVKNMLPEMRFSAGYPALADSLILTLFKSALSGQG